jgi:hypothetical protein
MPRGKSNFFFPFTKSLIMFPTKISGSLKERYAWARKLIKKKFSFIDKKNNQHGKSPDVLHSIKISSGTGTSGMNGD